MAVGPWAAANRYRTLYPLRRVRILRLAAPGDGPSFRADDVTGRLPDHLRWPLGLVKELDETGEEGCQAREDALRTWLEGVLPGGGDPGQAS